MREQKGYREGAFSPYQSILFIDPRHTRKGTRSSAPRSNLTRNHVKADGCLQSDELLPLIQLGVPQVSRSLS
jgi:hypothetical protein